MTLLVHLMAGVAAAAATPAQDVADISTRVCYAWAAGTLAVPNGSGIGDAQEKALIAHGLTSGLDKSAYDGLGQLGTAMVSQAIMGGRVNGEARIVLSLGGRQQVCRTLLEDEPRASTAADTETALVAAGWRRVAGLGSANGPVERRVFLRRDPAGKPYMLNLILLPAGMTASGRLRLFTTVALVPSGVQIPEGF